MVASLSVRSSRACGVSWLLRWVTLQCVWLLLAVSLPVRAEPVASLVAGGRAVPVPKDLMPWVPWVSDTVTDGLCPKLGDQALCVWPAALSLEVGTAGANFAFEVYLDFDSWVALPGSERNWPEDVRSDGKSAVVLSKSGVPATRLPRGQHRLVGRFAWDVAPETLMVPSNVGLIKLLVKGRVIEFPRREDNGALWLQAGAAGGQEATDRADIEVFRRIEDAVPLRVETLVVLRISGKSRELRLTGLTLSDTRLLELKTLIPARTEANGELVLQVHAGEHRVTLKSLYPVPPERLAFPKHASPWPEHETWVFVPDNALRQVVLTGAPNVDPAQTNLPAEWKPYPAFFVSSEQAIAFETKRRGEPTPLPNQLALERQWWLGFDGLGYTVKDHLTGTLSRSFRLDLKGYALGHAAVRGQDLLVTRSPAGDYGVELRQPKVDLNAEWRYEGKLSDVPAIGWQTDVTSLSATLNLPPGWDILHVTGADSTSDTWWSRWSLWGFFYVLLIAIAVARLLDYRYGLLALVTLGLIYGRDDAPMAYWAVLLALLALLRLVPEGWFRRGLRLAWVVTALVFAVVAVEFSIGEVRGAFFPTTRPPAGADSSVDTAEDLDKVTTLGTLGAAAERPEPVPVEPPPGLQPEAPEEKVAVIQQALQEPSKAALPEQRIGRKTKADYSKSGSFAEPLPLVDPDAVVQTGPGLPSWRWRTVEMRWSGPVQRDQRLHLYLLSPIWTKVFGVLRVLGLVWLALTLVRKTAFGKAPPPRVSRFKSTPAVVAALLGCGLFVLPVLAQAQPSSELLSELRTRLTEAPDCESCLEVESLELRVERQLLTTRATVHVGAVASYRVPGPVRSWVPETVLVDGRPANAMVLGSDGFLYVRLEPGSHRVQTSGPVSGSEWVITPGSNSHRVKVLSDGYTVDGLRDGRVEGSLHFTATNQPKEKAAAGAGSSEPSQRHLPSWLEITRTVELGVTWRITTEVVRKSPVDEPISLRYALLPGEEVTEQGAIVEQGQLVVALGRDDERVSYRSVLKPASGLSFTAATARPWSEEWRVRCSALWHCAFDGVAPYAQTDQSGYAPRFRPWPGEKLTVTVVKPVAAAGASRTIERVTAKLTPGQRLLLGEIELVAKVSKAGEMRIRLESGATVQRLTINGHDEPIRNNGSSVELSLQPGRQTVQLNWHEPKPQRFWFTAPRIVLDGQAVNAKVGVRLPSERWLLFTWGPSWGPKVLLWSYLLMLVGAAWILVRIPKNPLRVWQWALLGLGLTQVPVVVALVVAAWFFLMAFRGAIELRPRFGKKLVQITLGLYTLAFLGCLGGAVYDGLVSNPDMLISGTRTADGLELSWYQDRVANALATPLVLSLPVVVFRLLNLLWALWLASSLLVWLRWGWQQYAQGGLWVPKLEKPGKPVESVEPSERVEKSDVKE